MQHIIRILIITTMIFGVVLLIYMHNEAVFMENVIVGSFAFVFIVAILQFAFTFTHRRLNDIRLEGSDFELTISDLHNITLRHQLNFFSITCVLTGFINLFFFLLNGLDYTILWTTVLIAVPFLGYLETKKSISKNYSIGEKFKLSQNEEQLVLDSGKKKHILNPQKDRIRLRMDNLILIQQVSSRDLHVIRLYD